MSLDNALIPSLNTQLPRNILHGSGQQINARGLQCRSDQGWASPPFKHFQTCLQSGLLEIWDFKVQRVGQNPYGAWRVSGSLGKSCCNEGRKQVLGIAASSDRNVPVWLTGHPGQLGLHLESLPVTSGLTSQLSLAKFKKSGRNVLSFPPGSASAKENSIWHFTSIMICSRNSWEKNDNGGQCQSSHKGYIDSRGRGAPGSTCSLEGQHVPGGSTCQRVWKMGGNAKSPTLPSTTYRQVASIPHAWPCSVEQKGVPSSSLLLHLLLTGCLHPAVHKLSFFPPPHKWWHLREF